MGRRKGVAGEKGLRWKGAWEARRRVGKKLKSGGGRSPPGAVYRAKNEGDLFSKAPRRCGDRPVKRETSSNGKRRTTWLGAYIKPPGYPRADRMQGLTEERKEDGKTKYGRTKTDYDGRRPTRTLPARPPRPRRPPSPPPLTTTPASPHVPLLRATFVRIRWEMFNFPGHRRGKAKRGG